MAAWLTVPAISLNPHTIMEWCTSSLNPHNIMEWGTSSLNPHNIMEWCTTFLIPHNVLARCESHLIKTSWPKCYEIKPLNQRLASTLQAAKHQITVEFWRSKLWGTGIPSCPLSALDPRSWWPHGCPWGCMWPSIPDHRNRYVTHCPCFGRWACGAS